MDQPVTASASGATVPSLVVATGSMGVKRKLLHKDNRPQMNLRLSTEVQLPGVADGMGEVNMATEIQSSAAVKDLFEGNYEDRRKFGVVDIFDTLGFMVSRTGRIIMYSLHYSQWPRNLQLPLDN